MYYRHRSLRAQHIPLNRPQVNLGTQPEVLTSSAIVFFYFQYFCVHLDRSATRRESDNLFAVDIKVKAVPML